MDFDFSIFTYKSSLEVIDEHSKTRYHSIRFGGGLKNRPSPDKPPIDFHTKESRFIQQIFEAYSDHKKENIYSNDCLKGYPKLAEHHQRQRVSFYHAESLKAYARDNVPPGTFKSLQEEIYVGVVDLQENKHVDALACMNTVTQGASSLALTENGLISVVKIQDRQGICHQLANSDRLTWKKMEEK